jgi:hypothetical protein
MEQERRVSGYVAVGDEFVVESVKNTVTANLISWAIQRFVILIFGLAAAGFGWMFFNDDNDPQLLIGDYTNHLEREERNHDHSHIE